MTQPATAAFLVGVGGGLGSLARYGLSLVVQRVVVDWPAGTFAANCLGCLCIGMIAQFAARGEALSPEARLFLATGFCGGFTTMSSMVYEAGQMLRSGEVLHASFYVAATLVGSLLAFFLGATLIRLAPRVAGALWS
jgi:CrcB protein